MFRGAVNTVGFCKGYELFQFDAAKRRVFRCLVDFGGEREIFSFHIEVFLLKMGYFSTKILLQGMLKKSTIKTDTLDGRLN